jgi:hypothetical protein
VDCVDVAKRAVQRVADADTKQHNEYDHAAEARPGVEIGPGWGCGCYGLGHQLAAWFRGTARLTAGGAPAISAA